MHIFFLDTEGLGAYDEEINHDTKIFLVAILISSLFIFNSVGTIDENSINMLSFIINLSKYLKVSSTDDNSSYNEYFPELLWLLRDFSLRLVDKEDKPITTKQYLENALNLETNEEKTKIRKAIKDNFKIRDCFTLIRPVENEKDLRNLEELSKYEFRDEFLNQCEILRTRVFSQLEPKSLNGKILSGNNLVSFLTDVIKAVNSGSIPVIENSWKYMVESENLNNMKNLVNNFDLKVKEFYLKELDSISVMPLNLSLFKNINLNSYNYFNSNNNNNYNAGLNNKIRNPTSFTNNNINAQNIITHMKNKSDDIQQEKAIDQDDIKLFKDDISSNNNNNNNNTVPNAHNIITNIFNNEDSQTDSFLNIKDFPNNTINSTSNSIHNQNLKLLKFNFNDFTVLLNKKKNETKKEILNSYLEYESTLMSKDSDEYKNFEDKFNKDCEALYKKFYEGEVELLIIKSFHERVEDKISNLFQTHNINNNISNNKNLSTSATNNYSKNFYKFILEVEAFIDELDNTFPLFKNKNFLINSKLFVIIKKYYEDCISKEKNIMEGDLIQAKNDIISLTNKIGKLDEEVKSINQENKAKISNYHDQIIELKGSNSGLKEQISNLENEKKSVINRLNEQIKTIESNYEEKIEKITLDKERIEENLREKESSLLSFKLQVDKQSSLNEQKISLSEKEIMELKERIALLIKDKDSIEKVKDDYESEIGILRIKEKELVEEKKQLENQIERLSMCFTTNTTSNITSTNNKQKPNIPLNTNTSTTNNALSNKDTNSFNKKTVVNTSHPDVFRLIKQNDYLKSQIDNTKKIYDDIIKNLRSSLQEKNIEYLKELNNKKIVETNKTLSNTLKNYEDRCCKLEEKLKTYIDYKTIVKATSTFQCKECYKQFSYDIFLNHISKCRFSIQQQEQNINQKIQDERKIQAYALISSYIEEQNKIEIMIEVNHRLQTWKTLAFLDQFITFNEKIREKYSEVNFDYDYLIDNDIVSDYITKEDSGLALLTQRLNSYFKAISNFEILNKSPEFKEFIEFNANYEELDNSVDQESVLNHEILNNLESTLNMTMAGNIGTLTQGFVPMSTMNVNRGQYPKSLFETRYNSNRTLKVTKNHKGSANSENYNNSNNNSNNNNNEANFNSTMYLINNPLGKIQNLESMNNINLYNNMSNIPFIPSNNRNNQSKLEYKNSLSSYNNFLNNTQLNNMISITNTSGIGVASNNQINNKRNFGSINFNSNSNYNSNNNNNISNNLSSDIKDKKESANSNNKVDKSNNNNEDLFWDELSRNSSKPDIKNIMKCGNITPIRRNSSCTNTNYLITEGKDKEIKALVEKDHRNNVNNEGNEEKSSLDKKVLEKSIIDKSSSNAVINDIVDVGNSKNNDLKQSHIKNIKVTSPETKNKPIDYSKYINKINTTTDNKEVVNINIDITKEKLNISSSNPKNKQVINLNEPISEIPNQKSTSNMKSSILNSNISNINTDKQKNQSHRIMDNEKINSKSNDYNNTLRNKSSNIHKTDKAGVKEFSKNKVNKEKEKDNTNALEYANQSLKKLINNSHYKKDNLNSLSKMNSNLMNDSSNSNRNQTPSEHQTQNYSKPSIFKKKNSINYNVSTNTNIANNVSNAGNKQPDKLVLKDILSKTPPKQNTLISLISVHNKDSSVDINNAKEKKVGNAISSNSNNKDLASTVKRDLKKRLNKL